MSWRHARASRHARGYGSAWDKIRIRVLERDFYSCVPCKRRDASIRPASEVDHIIPRSRGGTDEMTNLQAICTDCHQEKTANEAAAARGVKRRPKARIGLDGWPA